MKIKLLDERAKVPDYAYTLDSGFDLIALEKVNVPAGGTVLVKTGLAFFIPENHEIQIRPRSGITLKTKLRVQLGTIDEGYEGEVKIIVDNIGTESAVIEAGTRIAQGVLAPITRTSFFVTNEKGKSERGSGGFGSTGV